MFRIRLINSSGEEEGSTRTSSSDKVLEEIKRALGTLKKLPAGAKVEIDWEPDPFLPSE